MSEISKLKGKMFTEQVNVWVDQELKTRLRRLKEINRINTAEEARKALTEMVEKLERAVS
jgi:hypothetical protein